MVAGVQGGGNATPPVLKKYCLALSQLDNKEIMNMEYWITNLKIMRCLYINILSLAYFGRPSILLFASPSSCFISQIQTPMGHGHPCTLAGAESQLPTGQASSHYPSSPSPRSQWHKSQMSPLPPQYYCPFSSPTLPHASPWNVPPSPSAPAVFPPCEKDNENCGKKLKLDRIFLFICDVSMLFKHLLQTLKTEEFTLVRIIKLYTN